MVAAPLVIDSRPGAHAGQRVLRVSGQMTFETERTFLEQVRTETAPVLILELSGVSNADSRAISALLQLREALIRESRQLALVGLNEWVRRPLEITRVKDFFSVFPTLESAEAALTPAPDGESARRQTVDRKKDDTSAD